MPKPETLDFAAELDGDLSALLGGILLALDGHEASFQKLKSSYIDLAEMFRTGAVSLPGAATLQARLAEANDTDSLSALICTPMSEDLKKNQQNQQKAPRPLYGPGSHMEEQSVHKKKTAKKASSLHFKADTPGADQVSMPMQLHGFLSRVVTSTQFELVMALAIVVNACTMSAALQLQGLHEAHKLGLRQEDGDWSAHKERFELIEYVFNAVYLLELALRLWAHGRYFARHVVNVLDAVIVLVGCVDTFIMQPQHIKMANVSVLRFIRLSHIFRIAKFLVYSQHLSEMRVLLRTIRLGIKGIVWSMMLLTGVIAAGGILMTQLAIMWIDDDSVKHETRIWLSGAFGTTAASIYTMFECSFTGGWRFYSRPLIEEVDYRFSFFWVCWIVFVNFMTMRIVGALFLKQTMEVAAVDAERLAMSNMKRKDKFAAALREIFMKVDVSGDGAISRDEFESMLRDQEVLSSFRRLDLDEDEVIALFTVLSDDDGCADYEEFLNGALKMNSSARTIDSVQVMHNQLSMHRDILQLLECVQPLKKLVKN